MCNETNKNKKQHQETKSERKKQAIEKISIVPQDEFNKFGRSQRRLLAINKFFSKKMMAKNKS